MIADVGEIGPCDCLTRNGGTKGSEMQRAMIEYKREKSNDCKN
jgi:hypothetical protein